MTLSSASELCGGIFTWQDVLEYVSAGATTVQIGSAFYLGDQIIPEILNGLNTYLHSHSITNLQKLRGRAHTFTNQLEMNPNKCP